MVALALDASPATACPAGDVNVDSHITVDEIMIALTYALASCPARVCLPAPTPLPTAAVPRPCRTP